jgi:hypothetical protein
MPRGTIHQAAAQSLGSSHLTISTYQRWSAADAVQHAVSVALADPQLQPLLPQPLKAGLPRGFLAAAAMGAADAADLAAAAGGFGPRPAAAAGGCGSGGRAVLAAQLAAACRSLADALEDAELGRRLLVATGDAMAEDFMRSRRAPPSLLLLGLQQLCNNAGLEGRGQQALRSTMWLAGWVTTARDCRGQACSLAGRADLAAAAPGPSALAQAAAAPGPAAAARPRPHPGRQRAVRGLQLLPPRGPARL